MMPELSQEFVKNFKKLQFGVTKQKLIDSHNSILKKTKSYPNKFTILNTIPDEKSMKNSIDNFIYVNDFKKTYIKELTLDNVHKGAYLLLKCIVDQPVIMNAFHSVVEDEKDGYCVFSVYNFQNILNPSKFNKGTMFKLYNPYFKIGGSCEEMLRVDDPNMIELVQNSLVDEANDLSAEILKMKGNEEIQKKNYNLAYEFYTKAILKDKDNPILYSNRCLASINMEDYEQGLHDVKIAIEFDKKNPKFFWRKALCLIGLEEYSEAENVLKEYANTKERNDPVVFSDFNKQIEKIQFLIKNTQGILPEELIKTYFSTDEQLVLANYINPELEIKIIENKGRGLCAKENIKAGELLIVEKAVAYEDDKSIKEKNNTIFELDWVARKAHFNPAVKIELLSKIRKNKLLRMRVDHLFHNSHEKQNFNYCNIDIFKSGAYSELNLKQTDTDYKLNIKDIEELDSTNAFGGEGDKRNKKKNSEKTMHSHGIWTVCSLMNHSCNCNTERIILSDYMFVQASKEILKGEEVTTYYYDISRPYKERQKHLKNYGFTCKCEICEYEKVTDHGKVIHSKIEEILDKLYLQKYKESLPLLEQFVDYLFNLDNKLVRLSSENLSHINKIFIKWYSNMKEATEKLIYNPEEKLFSLRAKIEEYILSLDQMDPIYINVLHDIGLMAVNQGNTQIIELYLKKFEKFKSSNSKIFLKWYEESYKEFSQSNPVSK